KTTPPLRGGVAAFCSSTGIGMVCGASSCAAHGTARPPRTRALTKYFLSMIFSWPVRANVPGGVLNSGANNERSHSTPGFLRSARCGPGRFLELDPRPPDQFPEMSLGLAVDLF